MVFEHLFLGFQSQKKTTSVVQTAGLDVAFLA